MFDNYQDLEKDGNVVYRRKQPTCQICDGTGSITAMHNRTRSIYEFMCSCNFGYEKFKNHEKSPVRIAEAWEKAKWKPSFSKVFTRYSVDILPEFKAKEHSSESVN